MKLILSILALGFLTSNAQATSCQAVTEKLISELWRVKPQFVDEKKSVYGSPMKKDFLPLNRTSVKSIEIGKAKYEALVKEGWVPSEAKYDNNALSGQRIEIKESPNQTSILRTGYVKKDSFEHADKLAIARADDIRITLDSDCKLAALEYLRPKYVKITAHQCEEIRDWKSSEMKGVTTHVGSNYDNSNGEKDKGNAALRAHFSKLTSDEPTLDRILYSCRLKMGGKRSVIASILPNIHSRSDRNDKVGRSDSDPAKMPASMAH